MAGVFLSYRDRDGMYCDRIYEALASRIGPRNVFRDNRSIRPGADYASTIRSQLSQCDLMIAIIGPSWIDGIERLDDEGDWVRRELTEAIERGITILPVLADTEPFTAAVLPDAVKRLAGKQFRQLRHRHVDRDLPELVDAVLEHLPDLIVSVDFPGSAEMRERIHQAARQAFGNVKVSPGDWEMRDDADGQALILVRAKTSPVRILGVWLDQLHEELRKGDGPQIRIGVHTGSGVTDVDLARRLARSETAYRLANASHAARVIVLVSDRIYQDVVGRRGRKVDPGFYRGVDVAGTRAWVTVPGQTVPPTDRAGGSEPGKASGTRTPSAPTGSAIVVGDRNNMIWAGGDVDVRQTHHYGRDVR